MAQTLIQTITVGAGGASTMDFSGIPNTFTDLYITLSSRTTTTDVTQYVTFTFNNNTTGYTYRYLFGNGGLGAGVFSSSGSRADMLGPITDGANATANTFGNAAIFIPNYAGNTNKSISIDGVMEQNATEAYPQIWSGLWSNTSAISSIQLKSNVSFVQGTTASLYGVSKTLSGPKATGGLIYQSGGYWVHVFGSSGTFTPNTNLTNVDYLVIAGGGGGGNAGGGAGGYRSSVTGESSGGGASAESKMSLTSGTAYTVIVGAGGSQSTPGGNTGQTNGSDSSFNGITSVGGGRGQHQSLPVSSGGSGGGALWNGGAGGAGTANQGYAGGAGGGAPYPNDAQGGGGGASSVGGNATGSGNAGGGGNGVTSSITGTAITRAGGGGSVGRNSNGVGGTGGGGNGDALYGTNGQIATGSGGGGGGSYGGVGGSGIVIVRYSI